MSDAKGPYKADEQALGGWLLDSRDARIANEAWKAGRASRDGLRSQLVSNNTVLFDVASLIGAGKYFDAIELCHAKVFGNNQALEDDGEGGK